MEIRPRPCQRCKVMIPVERIEVSPETRLCVDCVRAVGGEFEVWVVKENIAKAGSLKKNYGGYAIRKRRKTIEPLDG